MADQSEAKKENPWVVAAFVFMVVGIVQAIVQFIVENIVAISCGLAFLLYIDGLVFRCRGGTAPLGRAEQVGAWLGLGVLALWVGYNSPMQNIVFTASVLAAGWLVIGFLGWGVDRAMLYATSDYRRRAGGDNRATPSAAAMSEAEAFECLGLPLSATNDDVKTRYRELARRVHPDMNGSPMLFRQINTAYELLRDKRGG